MTEKRYLHQATLMLSLLPYIAKEACFALKGGTAINLFVRDMPRLSVDIDLAYLPLDLEEENDVKRRMMALSNIGEALDRIAQAITSVYKVWPITTRMPVGENNFVTFTSKLLVMSRKDVVKIEPNIVFRGAVFAPDKRSLVQTAQERFGLSTAMMILSMADLYGGKLCAALDRQHPRDLFDVLLLLQHEGITEGIRQAATIYIAGSQRPIHELLDPHFKDIQKEYESNFRGMTESSVSYDVLVQCQHDFPNMIRRQLSHGEREFLVSLCAGDPQWHLSGHSGIEKLPALQWKLQNIRKMEKNKRDEQLQKLTSLLLVT